MKIEFIKRGAATRLILIFAGWSTDARYYSDCVVDGWDTAVVSDYRDLTMPGIPAQYSIVYVFAYSLGVWAASRCDIPAAARIAVCGSEMPVSDRYGIPEGIFRATADSLTPASLGKFHLRMAGGPEAFRRIVNLLPVSPDIQVLKDELYAIAAGQDGKASACRWDKVYIAVKDRIFPADNLSGFWHLHPETVMIRLDSSHAVDIARIVRDSIPDPVSIGAGFFKAASTYNDNAVIQAEICKRVCDKVEMLLAGRQTEVASVLEIGVGQGLLTGFWRMLLTPSEATYVDLLPMPEFRIAATEHYIIGDAEQWLADSSLRFDVILSASAVQWFADPIGFINTVRRHLNPGGFAVISTFAAGNLRELDAVRPSPVIYRSADEYRGIPGVQVEEWERTLSFSSSREMMMHLRLTGVTPRHSASSSSTVKEGNPALRKSFADLPSVLTYRPVILCVSDDMTPVALKFY